MKNPILVFIDAGVDNYQLLFDGVVGEAQPFVLNTATDGIQQIDEILRQYPGQKTVHIISHGAPGCLYLGNTQLSLGTLKQYAPQLGQWDIDNLLLYGCHVAAGDAGEEFVSKLQSLTGANIAASKSLTGAAVKGGNWELELTTSKCDISLALSEAAMVAYSGVLQVLNADDYAALKALYEGTDGANWNNNTGWSGWDFSSSTPPDASVVNDWYGVTVVGDRVTILNLSSNQLTGEIPEQLGNLSSLQTLLLYSNQLSGEIPSELGNLSNLQRLELYSNQLTGEIPEQLGNLSNLQRLELYNNQLTGEIPEQLGNLSNLQDLILFNNQLTGEIPEQLVNLSSLQRLILHNNQLTGEIPEQLGNLSNLQRLILHNNQLTGEIPEQLGNLSNLQDLILFNNQLTGEIPEQLGNLSNLQRLLLDNNQLTGEIPEQLGNLSSLQQLWLHNNQLTGEIPEQLGNLSNLQDLILFNNQLTGEIPEQLGNLSNLQRLELYRNQLSGEIPEQLGNLSNLQTLELHNNELTGEIPEQLGNLSNLQTLELFNNELTGEIPEQLGNLSNLQRLLLLNNQLTGEIPEQLGNLSNLQRLELHNNELIGEIPEQLGNLSNLQTLLLHNNELTGEIPEQLGNLSNLQTLLLYSNELTGEIPEQLGNLSNLQTLLLYSNELSGEIPEQLGNLSNLKRLELYSNELTGEIPEQLGNLSNLQELFLFNNQLTGEIPQSVNDLSADKRLDNPPYVETEIPDQTTTTDTVFNLDISNNFGDINQDISTYSAQGLPDGLSINTTTGVISGTPTVGGNYTITVKVSDGKFTPAQDTFDIEVEQVGEVNQPPTDITLSNDTIDENVPANTEVGTLSTTDPNTDDTFTYALIAGEGDTDNVAFTIDDDQLKINTSPDFETQDTYNIRVQTTDAAGETYEEELTISVNNIKEGSPPIGVVISNDSIDENVPANTEVGILATFDRDVTDTFTYALVSGNGDTDNADFTIDGNVLKIKNSPDFETQDTYNIRVQTTDPEGETSENPLIININDVNELPTDINLDNDSIDENVAANTVVGTLSTTDPDTDDTFTYKLVSGAGDTDNAAFTIDGDELKIKNSPDFETQDTYNIRVQTTDTGGETYEKELTININDVNEAPTDINLDNDNINENVAPNTVVGTLSTTDPDTNDTFTYELVSGAGDTDNAAFTIDGDELKIKNSPDFETQDTYNIRVQTTDIGGETYQKEFTININDVNEPVRFDFNGDGVADIFWRHGSSGANRIWLMNENGTRDSQVNPGKLGIVWDVAGVGDFNGDEVADIGRKN
ncbi:MAG: DUF4347 domain-containing protein [Okeania sp. SIO3B3]|nr:DUF4347 domain-containing protein [Okeania sp. SIO3B3]